MSHSQHGAFVALSPTVLDTYKLLQNVQSTQAQTLRRLDGIESALHSLTMAVNSEISLQHLTLRTAGPRVVNETEALERVLEHLPIRSILLFQRVNKRCKAVVDGSERVQRALFMLPEPSFPASGRSNTPRLNSLFTAEALRKAAPVFGAKFDYGAEGLRVATILPLELTHEKEEYRSAPVVKLTIHTWEMQSTTKVSSLHPSLRGDTPGLANGSWSKMYLSQPPLPVDVSYDGYMSYNKRGVERRSGRLDQLVQPWGILSQNLGRMERREFRGLR